MSQTDLIRMLRGITQAGMKDCKSALEEAGWDLDKAVDIIKVKGQNIVSGRSGKVAAEGVVRIGYYSDRDNPTKVMVEVNCQTDFVANSEPFQQFVSQVVAALVVAQETGRPFQVSDVEEARAALVASTKENIVVRRWWVEQAISPLARVFSYQHSNQKIGVLLTLLATSEEAANSPEFTELGEGLAMQVAAMSPLAISSKHLPQAEVDRQKMIFETQLIEAGKPQDVWLKIMVGKFLKWHSEVCLLNQESVLVPKSTVEKVIEKVSAKLGGEITVVNFLRCQVGEGIEKVESNFAEEVANMAK